MLWQPEEYRQRPREYDPALAELIVDQVANGGNLIELCQGNRDYPLPATFLRWVEEDPLLGSQYATALRVRTDVLVEELLHVAADHDAKRGRNQMDARKFHAERLVPAKYGPRAYQLTPKAEEDAPGIDYGAEVRRKLAQMAARAQASAAAAEEAAKDQG